jgi:hypothetical protein
MLAIVIGRLDLAQRRLSPVSIDAGQELAKARGVTSG